MSAEIDEKALLAHYEEMLATVTAEREHLDRKQAALEKAIAGIKELLGLNANEVVSSSYVDELEVLSDAFKEMETRPAARKYLESVGRPRTTREILTALKSGGWSTTSNDPIDFLNNALKRGQERPDAMFQKKDGKWGLGTWDKEWKN